MDGKFDQGGLTCLPFEGRTGKEPRVDVDTPLTSEPGRLSFKLMPALVFRFDFLCYLRP